MEQAIGSIYVRSPTGNGAPKGWRMHGHPHNFHHATFLGEGRWRAEAWRPQVDGDGSPLLGPDGQPLLYQTCAQEVDGPYLLSIDREVWHAFDYLGHPVPAWMEPFLAELPPDRAAEFRRLHDLTLGHAKCIYSHRTPQGDVVEQYTGWGPAYT